MKSLTSKPPDLFYFWSLLFFIKEGKIGLVPTRVSRISWGDKSFSCFPWLADFLVMVSYRVDVLLYQQMWCKGGTTDCCFSNLGLVHALTCWKVTMVRLSVDDPFWIYSCWMLVGQLSHKNNTSLSSALHFIFTSW